MSTTPGTTPNYSLPTVNDSSGDLGAAALALLKTGTPMIDTKLKEALDGVAAAQKKSTRETQSVAAGWTQLVNAVENYKYSTSVTLSTTIDANKDIEIELINDNLPVFAKYGFGIAAVNGQVLTIYATDQPVAAVSLTFAITEV